MYKVCWKSEMNVTDSGDVEGSETNSYITVSKLCKHLNAQNDGRHYFIKPVRSDKNSKNS